MRFQVMFANWFVTHSCKVIKDPDNRRLRVSVIEQRFSVTHSANMNCRVRVRVPGVLCAWSGLGVIAVLASLQGQA